jgi:hypothetical protein
MVGRKRSEEDVPAEEDKTTTGESRLYGFRAVYVFDVTQTEGKAPPR